MSNPALPAPTPPESLESRRLLSVFVRDVAIDLGGGGGGGEIVNPPGAAVEAPMPALHADETRGWPRNVTAAGDTPHRLAVRFTGSAALDTSTVIGNDDAFVVTGPRDFRAPLRFVGQTEVHGDFTAVYEMAPPGGAWDRGDNGQYLVSMAVERVRDRDGQPLLGRGFAGTFHVEVPHPLARFRGDDDLGFISVPQARRTPRRPAPVLEVAFDRPATNMFEAAVRLDGGLPLTGAAVVKGNRVVVVATGADAAGRPRAMKLTGRVNRFGSIVGKWVEMVEGRRGKASGAFFVAPRPAAWLFE